MDVDFWFFVHIDSTLDIVSKPKMFAFESICCLTDEVKDLKTDADVND